MPTDRASQFAASAAGRRTFSDVVPAEPKNVVDTFRAARYLMSSLVN